MRLAFWQRSWCVFLFVLLLSLGILPNPLMAAESNNRAERVVLVLMDRVDIDDYKGLNVSNLMNLAKRGSVGLLNNNTGGGLTTVHTYPTIGGGSHLVGTVQANQAFNESSHLKGISLRDEYRSRTDLEPSPGTVLQLGIGELIRNNQVLRYPAKPGALGESLHQAKLKTAVIGNADTTGEYRRLASTITMDGKGVTDMGDVEESVLTRDPFILGGFRTNYHAVLEKFEEYRQRRASLIVLETGDSSRIYEEKDKATDMAYKEQRELSLLGIDRFIGQLAARMDFSKEVLLVITPTPTDEAITERKNLTLIVALGPEFTPGTLLTSGTTKRDGIIMNTDIAPSILKSLGLQSPVHMSGRPVYSSNTAFNGSNFEFLQTINQEMVTVATARLPIHTTYITSLIIVMGVALYSLFFNHPIGMKPFLLAIMAFPLAELLVPLLPSPSVTILILELIIATIMITGITVLVDKKLSIKSLVFLSLVTAGFILTDIINGSYLQKGSLLGYDPIVGARFYGIGNEYAGVLTGSLIFGITAAIEYWSRWRKLLMVVGGFLFLFAIYAIGAPHLGTKVGGAISVIPAFLVTFLLLLNVRFRLRTVFMVGAVAVLGVLGFIIYDLSRPPELRSHIGTIASLLLVSGPGEALNIIQRKWAVNLRLLQYSAWSRALLVSLSVFGITYYWSRGIKNIRTQYPYIIKGFAGILTAALISLVVNDAGVLAAATTLIFGAPPLLYILLKNQFS